MSPAVSTFLNLLLGPHPRIESSEQQRGARLFAALILIQVTLVVCGLFVVNAVWLRIEGERIWADPDSWIVMGGVVVLAAAYAIIRAGFYRAGAILFIAATSLVAVTAPFSAPRAEIGLLATLVIPVLLAAIVLPPRWVFLLLALLAASSLALLLLVPMPPAKVGTGFALILVCSVTAALVIVFRAHFSALEKERLAQIEARDAAVLASEKKLRTLLASSQDMIMVLDTRGMPLFVEGGYERITGLRRQDLLGARGAPEVHPEDRNRVDEEFAKFLRGSGATSRSEWRQRHADGRWIWVEGIGTNQLDTEGVHGIVVSVRDISGRKQAEEQRLDFEARLQQASKLQSIGRLAGGVAHDFNNLLTVVIGNAELLRDALGEASPGRDLLAEIRKAADSAVMLTRQLLTFSRRQVVEPRVLDLNASIEPLRAMLSRLIGENISLRTELGDGVGSIRIDPGLLEQIVVNLAVNARDAMPDGGMLVIRTGRAEGTADAVGAGFAELSIEDNGCGMSPEVMKHMFEPFFTTKARGRGTGLGLATVYGAVQQSGGRIEASSEQGRGSRFTVHLPVVGSAAEDGRGVEVRAPAAGGTETILVVEDERSIRELTRHTLSLQGYEVLTAASAEEALAMGRSRTQPIHLLLTDVVLPGMNGKQLAAELGAAHPETAVLYCSGYSHDIIAHHGVLEEGIEFLGKPYALDELSRRVREVLDRSRQGG